MILLAYINSQGWKFLQTDLPIQVADEKQWQELFSDDLL